MKSEVHFSIIVMYQMVGQAVISPIWSQYDLTTQTVDTIPNYDSAYVYLACLGLAVLAAI